MGLSRRAPRHPRFDSDDQQADDLFDAVSESLRDHGDSRATKEELRASLKRADAAFQQLHDWITQGRGLPDPWRRHFAPRSTDGVAAK
jgi:hypothetical protein